jgi:Tfp pilus assembly protein PilZ
MSGAMLKSPREYPPGEELMVVFNTPNARRPLTIPAEVVWSDVSEKRGGKRNFNWE